MIYRYIHIQFYCRSAKSLSFNWVVEIFVKKYVFFTKIRGKKIAASLWEDEKKVVS